MTFARLDNPENHAIAIFGHGHDYTVVVGNVRQGDVPAVNQILQNEARQFFGEEALKGTGSAKSENRDALGNHRWDCHITVATDSDGVMEFCQRKLKGGANQIC